MVSLSTGRLSAWIQERAGWKRGQWCKAIGAQHTHKQVLLQLQQTVCVLFCLQNLLRKLPDSNYTLLHDLQIFQEPRAIDVWCALISR